jgi:hypothetical protein
MQGFAVRETVAHLEYAVHDGRLIKALQDGIYRYSLS